MEKQEVGRFYAKTFNDDVFEFIVYDDNTMVCPKLTEGYFKKIIIKPRFILLGKNSYYQYDAKADKKYKSAPGLIREYDIDEELFDYLRKTKMIKYSTDMAYLYGFSDKNGYEEEYSHVSSPYKWAKKKGPILIKQKNGKFN